ncbi:MAG: hypothetical protein KDB63_16170 [Nocardioidaceae bacterium]|nr:hypothetical protein [Nocardioidaceae bacterium]
MPSPLTSRRLVGALAALAVAVPVGVPLASAAQPAADPSAVSSGRDTLGKQASERPGRAVGHWRVAKLGPESWRVSWRSPERLPVTSDRPTIARSGASLGPSVISRDGRVVSVDVRSAVAPRARDLDVLLSGDRLDVTGDDVLGGHRVTKAATPDARATTPLPDDPATPGPYEIVSSDYELAPVAEPGMDQPIEMVGHVVEPAASEATGPRPIVLFLHGRHSYCYNPKNGRDGGDWPCLAPFQEIPSHLGYDYIQQVLASQGYFTVSIRVNGINAQDWALDDGGADARADIVEKHLDYWATQVAEHQLNPFEVVLVGHSRGGEGVDRASLEIPLSADYRVAGQVLIAPTDFGGQTAAYVPTVTLLPYCDGDVFDLQGQGYTDDSRDLTSDDTSLKSSVLVMGANHNFFNTEWTPGVAEAPAWDDWGDDGPGLCGTANPGRLSDAEQRSVGLAYVAGAVHLFASNEQEYLPMFDGSAVTVASTGDAEVFSHALGGGREVLRPDLDAGLALSDGADTQLCLGAYTWMPTVPHRLCGRYGDVAGNVPHWTEQTSWFSKRRAFEMSWDAPGQRGGMVLDHAVDLNGSSRLDLRTIVDPTVGDVSLRVRLVDETGNTETFDPVGGPDVAALPSEGFLGKRWAQSVSVVPAGAVEVDLSRIVEIDIIGDSPQGRIWILDAAAVPAAPAAVPAKRLPVLSLGTATVTEGDTRNETAAIPFTVSGTVTSRAHLEVGVLSYGPTGERTDLVPIDLAPGQTEGAVVVDYPGNKIDDMRTLTFLSAFPRTGAMTDAYFGRLTVVDDDPTPPITIKAVKPRVREGSPARWSVTLDKRVGYYVAVQARAVGGNLKGPKLLCGDVPRRWLTEHGVLPRVGDSVPLHEAPLFLYQDLNAGRTTLTLAIPTRKDGKREGAEAVTLRFRIRLADRTVVVDRTVRVVG